MITPQRCGPEQHCRTLSILLYGKTDRGGAGWKIVEKMKSFNTSAEETSLTVSLLIFYYFLFSILKIPNTKTGFKKAALGVFFEYFFFLL